MSTCVFQDGWHLLIHFPRQLFVKLCLVFTARMCHEWFWWSTVDSWAAPRTPRLTGSACLNVETAVKTRPPISPVTCTLQRVQPPNISIHHWTQHIPEQTGGHNRVQRRPKRSWVLPSSGQAPHEDNNLVLWKESCMFYTFNSLICYFKQSWIPSSEEDAATLPASNIFHWKNIFVAA